MSLLIRSAGYSDAGNPSPEAELKAHYLRARRHPAAKCCEGLKAEVNGLSNRLVGNVAEMVLAQCLRTSRATFNLTVGSKSPHPSVAGGDDR